MRFNKSIIDIIKERTSRRTYIPKLLDEDVRDQIEELMQLENIKSPFSELSGNCRFELIAVPEFDPREKKKMGTYGVIKGAQEFIVGAVVKSDYMKEHYGYLMEWIILGATDLDLGTCWLGGFFNRTLFSEKINANANEILPAITPIGYSEKRRTKEIAIRKFVKADNRYPWDRLFFEENFSTPLNPDIDEEFKKMLEMVQLGPSAGNKQPWRIVKERDKNTYHFYIDKAKGVYNKFQSLDIGIAVCHWDLTSQELEIKGNWEIKNPTISHSEELEYKITWKEI